MGSDYFFCHRSALLFRVLSLRQHAHKLCQVGIRAPSLSLLLCVETCVCMCVTRECRALGVRRTCASVTVSLGTLCEQGSCRKLDLILRFRNPAMMGSGTSHYRSGRYAKKTSEYKRLQPPSLPFFYHTRKQPCLSFHSVCSRTCDVKPLAHPHSPKASSSYYKTIL